MEESWGEEVMFVGGGELGSEVSAGNTSGFSSIEDFLKCGLHSLIALSTSSAMDLNISSPVSFPPGASRVAFIFVCKAKC